MVLDDDTVIVWTSQVNERRDSTVSRPVCSFRGYSDGMTAQKAHPPFPTLDPTAFSTSCPPPVLIGVVESYSHTRFIMFYPVLLGSGGVPCSKVLGESGPNRGVGHGSSRSTVFWCRSVGLMASPGSKLGNHRHNE